jgi:hypothetical protein
MIPADVINRIRSGLVVYAKVPAALPDHEAELYVGPVIEAL